MTAREKLTEWLIIMLGDDRPIAPSALQILCEMCAEVADESDPECGAEAIRTCLKEAADAAKGRR